MNANTPARQGSRCEMRLKSYGWTLALMAMSGSAVLLVLDVLEILR
uniref:Uncharacterized protein n=1 Tax=Streptomyces sp. NBC_00093 TaxID=2975649 RepID=A0AAU2A3N0_9ACTN